MKLHLLAKAFLEAPSLLRSAKLAAVSQLKAPTAKCPVCGFEGKFLSFGDPVRTAVQCPQCWSLERHRLLALAVKDGRISFEGKDVLAFAADSATARACKGARRYSTSNYPDANGADHSFNIEATNQSDGSYDAVVCSHVLEHVDDKKALAELFRILRPGGHLIFMVPLIEGWNGTYEDPSIQSEQERHVHFGQFDHVRYYGADVRQRAVAAGFIVSEVTAGPTDSLRHGLQRGEKIFVGLKPLETMKQ